MSVSCKLFVDRAQLDENLPAGQDTGDRGTASLRQWKLRLGGVGRWRHFGA